MIDPNSADKLLRASRRFLDAMRRFQGFFNSQGFALKVANKQDHDLVHETRNAQRHLELIVTALETSKTFQKKVDQSGQAPEKT